MNYDQTISELLATIKADKTIIQPWRNKAHARLEEAQAFIRMGRTSTNIQPPPGQRILASDEPNTDCICLVGAIATDCPVHGLLAK